MNETNNQIKYNIEQFCGKINEETSRSLFTLQMFFINKNTGETEPFANFASSKLFSQVKILDNFIVLDINYTNPLDEEYNDLIGLMEIYDLFKSSEVEVINIISLVENKDLSESQLMFLNPVFFAKHANTTGRPINGFRLSYNFDSVLYQNDIDTELRAILEDEDEE